MCRAHYTAAQDLLLHSTFNDVHPNENGSYLIACAAFVSIFREPVTGAATFGDVSTANSTDFQAIADSVILPHLAVYGIGSYDLTAAFDHTIQQNTVSFQNTSQNYDSLSWNFGDGATSNDLNPVHTFTSNGTYQVQLLTFRDGCSDIISKEVSIHTVGINDIPVSSGMTFYPNPATEKLMIKSQEPIEKVLICSIDGKVMLASEDNIGKSERIIGMGNLPSSSYILKVWTKSTTYVRKLIKK